MSFTVKTRTLAISGDGIDRPVGSAFVAGRKVVLRQVLLGECRRFSA